MPSREPHTSVASAAQSLASTEDTDTHSTMDTASLASSNVHHYPQHVTESIHPHTNVHKDIDIDIDTRRRSGTGNLLTRTSTVISNIIDDNRFARTQVQPNPSFDPNDCIKVGTAAAATAENENENESNLEEDAEEVGASSYDEEKLHDHPERQAEVQDTGEYNKFDIENRPPDGGFWAWTSAICVLMINTFSWGMNACFGVFLNYYTTKEYFKGAQMEQYVMIGGLGLGLSFLSCAFTNGLCRRYNYKLIMSIGTALTFLAYWLASISKTVIQLIMFQGFLMAIGWALVAGSTFVILPSWFLKKRSIAQGIATAGGGLGGIIFARPIDEIIKMYINKPEYANNPHEGLKQGIAWALRMEAFVCGFMLTISVFLIRTFRPLKDTTPKSERKPLWYQLTEFLTRVDLIKSVPLLMLVLWNMVYGLAYTILLFSLSSYATSIGLTYKQGSNVTTVQSVAQTVGRPVLGLLSERIGRVNTTVISTVLIAIFVFFFWIFVETYSELLAFAFLAGFFLGVNWVNFGPMTADIVGGGGKDLNHAISIQMFTGGFPLLIAELAGFKLRRPHMEKQFLYCQILVGVSCIVSAALLMPFREWKVRRILLARRKLFIKAKDHQHFDVDDVELQEFTIGKDPDLEIERLNTMLLSNPWAYTLRMCYPIAV
jgi:MFS family permease